MRCIVEFKSNERERSERYVMAAIGETAEGLHAAGMVDPPTLREFEILMARRVPDTGAPHERSARDDGPTIGPGQLRPGSAR